MATEASRSEPTETARAELDASSMSGGASNLQAESTRPPSQPG